MDLLAHLATFVRIVDAGSLSGAARALRLSLPAVSRQLKSLEDELGVTLVMRSTRRLSVTDDGRQWYERAQRVLREIDEARRSRGGAGDVRGTLVVSAPITIASHLVIPRLPAIHRAHPELAIDLRLEDRFVDLVGDGVDVAIRGGAPPPDTTSFVALPVLEFQRWLVASPAYLRRSGCVRDPEELAGHACLPQLGASGPVTRWRFAKGDEERVVDVRGPVRATAPLAIRELALAGMGLALLPEWLVAGDVLANRLKRAAPGWETPRVTTWALYRAELRGSPRIRAFLDAIRGSNTAASRRGSVGASREPR
jgi:DNA-binding transcriptional LysR family regulator